MEESDTWNKLVAVAVDILKVPAEKVIPSASFGDDLNADSLDLVEFAMALEEAFEIKIEEAKLAEIKTVGQAFEVVKEELSAPA